MKFSRKEKRARVPLINQSDVPKYLSVKRTYGILYARLHSTHVAAIVAVAIINQHELDEHKQ